MTKNRWRGSGTRLLQSSDLETTQLCAEPAGGQSSPSDPAVCPLMKELIWSNHTWGVSLEQAKNKPPLAFVLC